MREEFAAEVQHDSSKSNKMQAHSGRPQQQISVQRSRGYEEGRGAGQWGQGMQQRSARGDFASTCQICHKVGHKAMQCTDRKKQANKVHRGRSNFIRYPAQDPWNRADTACSTRWRAPENRFEGMDQDGSGSQHGRIRNYPNRGTEGVYRSRCQN